MSETIKDVRMLGEIGKRCSTLGLPPNFELGLDFGFVPSMHCSVWDGLFLAGPAVAHGRAHLLRVGLAGSRPPFES